MDSIEKLAEHFAKFPGVGSRQAKRFVYFLLRQDKAYIDSLMKHIDNLKNNVLECSKCHRFFSSLGSDQPICSICSDTSRDQSTLMVVEKDVDLEAIERSKTFTGVYFVLGGSVPILEKDPRSKIRAEALFYKVQNDAATDLTEVILALGITPEGDNTERYIAKILEPVASKHKLKMSRLGRGLSTGTELEYSDGETLRHALESRT